MAFPNDTFVTLDLPKPFSSVVAEVRLRHRDVIRVTMPAHVTLTGSGGVGVFEAEQDRDEVFARIDEIAAATAPIDARFGPVLSWPPFFVLSYEDEDPLRALHQRLAHCGIRFGPAKFPFVPHTTVCSRPGATDGERDELMDLWVPGEFRLDTMSVYEAGPADGAADESSVWAGPAWVRLLHRTRLTG
jgi:2'-5' RNA ligase